MDGRAEDIRGASYGLGTISKIRPNDDVIRLVIWVGVVAFVSFEISV